MKIDGEYIFDAPQDIVWKAVRDPDVLGSVVPGGEGVEEIGENEYSTKLKVKVGPVQGKFNGKIKLSNIVEPNSYDIEVDGKGAPGFVKATGSLLLSDQGEKTHLAYSGDAKIGGRIASVGQRLIDASAKSIIGQSLDALNAYLQVQVAQQKVVEEAEAAGASAEEIEEKLADVDVPEYTPPTQTQLAMNVAKDVADDLIPAQYRPVLIIVGIIVVLAILYFIFF